MYIITIKIGLSKFQFLSKENVVKPSNRRYKELHYKLNELGFVTTDNHKLEFRELELTFEWEEMGDCFIPNFYGEYITPTQIANFLCKKEEQLWRVKELMKKWL